MTTTPRRSGSEIPAAQVPFSYAQAAKGLSSANSSRSASKPASESITPSKESHSKPSSVSAAAGLSWADDAEISESTTNGPVEKTSSVQESLPNGVVPPTKQPPSHQHDVSSVSSPDIGTSSSSTVIKDDDVSSLHNNSSESTWENKSQASNSIEKTENDAPKPGKSPEEEPEKSSSKPFQEAPPPVVNIWAKRAEELKARTASKPAVGKSSASQTHPISNGPPQALTEKLNGTARPEPRRKSKGLTTSEEPEIGTKDRSHNIDPRGRPRDERISQSRREAKVDAEGDRNRRSGKSRPLEKDSRSGPAAIPLPPDRDQGSWPTPNIAVDEGKRKAQEKGEKTEKDRNQSVPSRPHGKQGWVSVPYTPNVIFQTPLPNTTPARRGGRGGRGTSQAAGRGNSHAANGISERDASTLPAGEQTVRGRIELPAQEETSPSKRERAASIGSSSWKETKSPTLIAEQVSNSTPAADPDTLTRRTFVLGESISGQQGSGNTNGYYRQYTSTRPNKGRKGDVPGDRRREGDLAPLSKDGVSVYDRRTSVAIQAEDDADKRNLNVHDGQGPQSKQLPTDRRNGSYSSFSGRDRDHRGRGGMRAGRGGGHGFQNGHHQFANGHPSSMQTSSTFPLARSPPTFHPEQNAYFPPPPNAQSRNYRSNGPRSQSMTAENLYGRLPNGYSGGPQPLAPIQTYAGGMYDYPVMQPMSAVPYSPYMDQYTLFSMVTTQLEYYFSVDNLCKDLHLRRHMDSKGFVFLSFIANFNRIKQLTMDMELIKLVCYQSKEVEFRVGVDGKDRLRRREGWESWVLSPDQREPAAQNDGPEELHHPPVPHPQGFEPQYANRYADVPKESPTSPLGGSNGFSYQSLNGPPTGLTAGPASQTVEHASQDYTWEDSDQSNRGIDREGDSFSDEQVESLSVIVRKPDQQQVAKSPPSATRTFSNGSIDSKTDVVDDISKIEARPSSLQVNGTGPSQGEDGKIHDDPKSSLNPLLSNQNSTMSPVRLYWVKGKDNPVESLPNDATHEFYTHLRSKALEQRRNAPIGNCPYDMDVLYQFWSHFLIRNFNTRMYNEFRRFAFDDASHKQSEVGLRNLIKYYEESLSSPITMRERIVRHYVDLIKQKDPDEDGFAAKQLKSSWRNGTLNPQNRERIGKYID